MPDHIRNRERMIVKLREELVGPAPYGEDIDCDADINIEESERGWGPFIQSGSRDEIIIRENPRSRYGVGVLYPVEESRDPAAPSQEQAATESEPPRVDASGWTDSPTELPATAGDAAPEPVTLGDSEGQPLREGAVKSLRRIKRRSGGPADVETLDLSDANTYRPSVMGVTFLAELPKGSRLIVEAPTTSQTRSRIGTRLARVNGRYVKKKVQIAGKERVWWLRRPICIRASFDAEKLRSELPRKLAAEDADDAEARGTEGLDLQFEVYTRPHGEGGNWLITVCLVNRTRHSGDEACLFQTHFRAWIEAPGGGSHICPYPSAGRVDDSEESSLSLLYRDALTFAVGHGCSADWDAEPSTTRAHQVWAECLPLFEAPSITPDVLREGVDPETGNPEAVEVPMAPLAGLVPGDDGLAAVREVVALYGSWIEDRRAAVTRLDPALRPTAHAHLDECEACLARMNDGLAYLDANETARRAFELANLAILMQQARSRVETRRIRYDRDDDRISFTAEHPDPPLNGRWRPFQIAFLLMSLRSSVDGQAQDRETVELIWFPTGGGKTEAYLGLAAFSIFARRLRARRETGEDDAGTHVLMRYTLRLLTTQQFQRASALLCAMEYLRRQNRTELGDDEFSIGIWVGGENTPNRSLDAVKSLRDLREAAKKSRAAAPPENPFVLTRCPWCAAQIGPIDTDAIVSGSQTRGGAASKRPVCGARGDKRWEGIPRVYGYAERDGTVIFKCSDQSCAFKKSLPVYVIDEDIYEKRPTLVIGTVDKFAMLAWRPDARGLFGISQDGARDASPPGLIIQDELHLISGPLGSMVGLYETVIEELCTDRRGESPVPPKIVSSTATIRRYREQIRALYGREQSVLFPPPGLDAGDSFFARYARNAEGKLLPGRIYVGVHGTGTGSLQTDQVRTFTALLQAPFAFSHDERDPWWTLLVFFNSLRVLGSGVSLFQSDIPEHFRAIRNREGLDWNQVRWLDNVRELTGRLRNTEVPLALDELAVRCGERAQPVDVCLASNIIEVGVDVERLSLISVVGQPKTTSQYIQVTGRVGRKWNERPGLVVTIYIVSQPRDRSLYEKFRSYHERLYAQVEPTSVTPFSPPALDRALHAVLTAYARQTGRQDDAETPWPIPLDLIERFRRILEARVVRTGRDARQVDEASRLIDAVLARRIREWTNWQPRHWDGAGSGPDTPLLRLAGAYASQERRLFSWPTPMSMRSVDAECRAEITQLYKFERSYGEAVDGGGTPSEPSADEDDEDDDA